MARINNSDELTVAVELQIPKPIIIWPDMNLQKWKQFFIQKMEETTDSSQKTLYNKCIKVLLWAEFCNAILPYVGNAKDDEGNLYVKFAFSFPDSECTFLFQMDLESNLKVVTDN